MPRVDRALTKAANRAANAVVREVVQLVIAALDAATGRFKPFAATLTKRDRQRVLRPPHAFPDAARAMVEMASADAPELAAACRFDGEAVLENLDNAALLVPLIARLKALTRAVEDTRMLWLSDAYRGALPLYRVASARAVDDAALESVMAPLHDVFLAARRRRPDDGEDGQDGQDGEDGDGSAEDA